MGRRRKRGRQFHTRLLPSRPQPLYRADDRKAATRNQEEPQSATAQEALPGNQYQSALCFRLYETDREVCCERKPSRRWGRLNEVGGSGLRLYKKIRGSRCSKRWVKNNDPE